VTERALLLSSTESLVGVLTDAAETDATRPAFVFLNAGLLHRIGPNRLHVRLARELAGRGFASLRFDLSGLGDSGPRRDGLPLRAAAVADTREALDALAANGPSTFVLAGLCSGADLAFRAALDDERVVGLVLIDGLPYKTTRAVLIEQAKRAQRLIRHGDWHKLGHIHKLVGRPAAPAAMGNRDVPTRADAAIGLRRLTERGVQVLAIYTEGREYMYPRQFAHLFPSVRPDRVRVEFFKDADHIFTLRANQDRLARVVVEWSGGFR